jgi:hypothetical protein
MSSWTIADRQQAKPLIEHLSKPVQRISKRAYRKPLTIGNTVFYPPERQEKLFEDGIVKLASGLEDYGTVSQLFAEVSEPVSSRSPIQIMPSAAHCSHQSSDSSASHSL